MSTDPDMRNSIGGDERNAEPPSRPRAREIDMERVWDLAAECRCTVLVGTSSAHDDLYDEHGLPR